MFGEWSRGLGRTSSASSVSLSDPPTDRPTDRRTNRHRQTDRQTDRPSDRPTKQIVSRMGVFRRPFNCSTSRSPARLDTKRADRSENLLLWKVHPMPFVLLSPGHHPSVGRAVGPSVRPSVGCSVSLRRLRSSVRGELEGTKRRTHGRTVC